MRYYRVHVLDDSARITGGFTLHCEDHHAACREASRLCAGRKWELWSGNERVHCKAHDTDHVCETGHACTHENPSSGASQG